MRSWLERPADRSAAGAGILGVTLEAPQRCCVFEFDDHSVATPEIGNRAVHDFDHQ